MFCGKCGNKIKEGDSFCTNCGAKINLETSKKMTEVNNEKIEIECVEDQSIVSGFVIRAGNDEYDWSEQGRVEQLRQKVQNAVSNVDVSQDDLISILKSEINEFELRVESKEVGIVTSVADATANVVGINHAFYGEIVVFDNNRVCGVIGPNRNRDTTLQTILNLV